MIPRMTNRRLPAPWTVDNIPSGYVVRDANGQALAYGGGRASSPAVNRFARWRPQNI